MKQHRFWAWAAVFCFIMVFYTGYRAQVISRRQSSKKYYQEVEVYVQ